MLIGLMRPVESRSVAIEAEDMDSLRAKVPDGWQLLNVLKV